MSCEDCERAKIKDSGLFRDCRGCRARAVARSVHFSKALKARSQHREYHRVLEQVGVTHEEVVNAALNDRACDRLMGVEAAP
jgi:hypothetical protein